MKVEIDGISYDNILKDISFSITKGDVIALVGINGAGKTTLLRNIMGLLKPTSGTINLEDVKLATVFQDNILDGELSIKQNYKYRINNKSQYEFALKKLGEFEINSKVLYSRLSGGQKRIVNYIRAMAMQPSCLILDELSAGIDVDIRQAIWQDLSGYLENGISGVIFTTHQLEEMDKANKVLFLESGEVKYFGNMTNFMDRMPKVKLIVKGIQKVEYFDSSEQAIEFVKKYGLQKTNFEIMQTSYTDLFQNMEAEGRDV